MSGTQQPCERRSGIGSRRLRLRLSAVVLALAGLLGGVVVAPAADAAPVEPRPVLIVGGTFQTQAMLNQITFLDDQYDVYTLQLSSWEPLQLLGGIPGSASMVTSARAVQAKVDRILDRTGAERLDVIGISQAALVLRYYIKNLGGLNEVDGYISFSGVAYGIPPMLEDPLGDLLLFLGCGVLRAPVCAEIVHGATPGDTPFLMELNEPDPTPGDIDYYHIYTETGVEPGFSERIPLPGAVNVAVQDVCPGRAVIHADIGDAAMQELVKAALMRAPLTSTCP